MAAEPSEAVQSDRLETIAEDFPDLYRLVCEYIAARPEWQSLPLANIRQELCRLVTSEKLGEDQVDEVSAVLLEYEIGILEETAFWRRLSFDLRAAETKQVLSDEPVSQRVKKTGRRVSHVLYVMGMPMRSVYREQITAYWGFLRTHPNVFTHVTSNLFQGLASMGVDCIVRGNREQKEALGELLQIALDRNYSMDGFLTAIETNAPLYLAEYFQVCFLSTSSALHSVRSLRSRSQVINDLLSLTAVQQRGLRSVDPL